MKRLIVFTASFLLTASLCFAGGFSYSDKSRLRDQGYSNYEIRKMEENFNSQSRLDSHVSPTGQRYEYDLSNSGDRIRYNNDAGAQIRDNIHKNFPKSKIDKNLGFQGGGILSD